MADLTTEARKRLLPTSHPNSVSGALSHLKSNKRIVVEGEGENRVVKRGPNFWVGDPPKV